MWRTQPHFTLQELGRIRSPTLVMAGEFDVIKRAHTDSMAAAIPGAQEYIIPGATHEAPLTHPVAVNAQIGKFLDARRNESQRPSGVLYGKACKGFSVAG
jgi:pimeloyl-ACP methyl ester carboxylesterase